MHWFLLRNVVFSLIAVYQICDTKELAAENPPRSVNLALETVFEFDSKENSADIKIINKVQSFLDKVKSIIKKNSQTRRSGDNKDGAPLSFTEFIKSFLVVLSSYDDKDLEEVASVIDDELRKYHYKGCRFHELIENREVRRFMGAKLDNFKTKPGKELKRQIEALIEKLTDANRGLKQKLITRYLDSLYKEEDSEIFNELLKLMALYKRKSKRFNMDLSKIIRTGFRRVLFDHYSKLDADTRRDVKMKLETLWQDFSSNNEQHNIWQFESYPKGSQRQREPLQKKEVIEHDTEKTVVKKISKHHSGKYAIKKISKDDSVEKPAIKKHDSLEKPHVKKHSKRKRKREKITEEEKEFTKAKKTTKQQRMTFITLYPEPILPKHGHGHGHKREHKKHKHHPITAMDARRVTVIKKDDYEPGVGDHKTRSDDHKPRAGDHKPRVGDHKSREGYHRPRVGYHKPRVVDHTPRMGDHKPWMGYHRPREGHHKPRVVNHKPRVGDHKSREDHQKPGVRDLKWLRDHKLRVGDHKPRVDDHKPRVGDHKPRVHDQKPIVLISEASYMIDVQSLAPPSNIKHRSSDTAPKKERRFHEIRRSPKEAKTTKAFTTEAYITEAYRTKAYTTESHLKAQKDATGDSNEGLAIEGFDNSKEENHAFKPKIQRKNNAKDSLIVENKPTVEANETTTESTINNEYVQRIKQLETELDYVKQKLTTQKSTTQSAEDAHFDNLEFWEGTSSSTHKAIKKQKNTRIPSKKTTTTKTKLTTTKRPTTAIKRHTTTKRSTTTEIPTTTTSKRITTTTTKPINTTVVIRKRSHHEKHHKKHTSLQTTTTTSKPNVVFRSSDIVSEPPIEMNEILSESTTTDATHAADVVELKSDSSEATTSVNITTTDVPTDKIEIKEHNVTVTVGSEVKDTTTNIDVIEDKTDLSPKLEVDTYLNDTKIIEDDMKEDLVKQKMMKDLENIIPTDPAGINETLGSTTENIVAVSTLANTDALAILDDIDDDFRK